MTASTDTHRATSGTFALVPVRRRDAIRLREYGPPPGVTLPAKHGGEGDPRYPSPHRLRSGLGFGIDLVLHVACATVGFLAIARVPGVALGLSLLAIPVTFIAASIVHRIFVQRLCHTTLGKAITGLCLIRDDSGGPPTLWSLTKAWLIGTLTLIASVLSGW
ncbi:MAG: hypothetical protein ACJ72N_20745 [Labedaea sp.]